MTPHEIRVSLFETKEQYLATKKEWAKTKNHTAQQHAIYNVLRGYEPTRGFTPITKQSRLDNGHRGAFADTCWPLSLHYGPKAWNKPREDLLKDTVGEVVSYLILEKAYELVKESTREVRND